MRLVYGALRLVHRMGKAVFDLLDRIGLRKLRPIALRAWWKVIALADKMHPETTVADGHRIHLDAKDSCHLALFGEHDKVVAAVFRKYVKPGNVVVDIGAHIGFFTLMSAKLAGPSGRVFAFEPEPANYALLEKNIAENGYRNIVAVQKAVSDRNGVIQLHVAEVSSGLHRIYRTELFGEMKPIDIETTTLDAYLGNGARVDFIKMDIEGAEPAAFAGMAKTLSANPHAVILTEFSPAAIDAFGVDPEAFIRGLEKTYRILHLGATGEEAIPIDELLRMYAPSTLQGANLLLVPREPRP